MARFISSNLNWFPQRVGTTQSIRQAQERLEFPFNWFPQRVGTVDTSLRDGVIPVGSGASRFHSIGFPSEWGPGVELIAVPPAYTSQTCHVCKFPFNRFPQRVGTTRILRCSAARSLWCFHSIGFPSEWGR